MTDEHPDKQPLSDEQVAAQVKQQLERKAGELDAATLSRLRQARALALAELDRQTPRRATHWLWAGGFATASVFAVALLVLVNNEQPANQGFEELLADTELLGEPDELEFFEELEFYVWLEEQGLQPGEA